MSTLMNIGLKLLQYASAIRFEYGEYGVALTARVYDCLLISVIPAVQVALD